MAKRRPNQPFDEVAAAGGADPGSVADAKRRAERRASARGRAAAESGFEQAQAAADTASQIVPRGAPEVARRVEAAVGAEAPVQTARKAGALAGNTVRYLRDLEAEDIVAQVKSFVRRYPATLAGAVVAGFITGRLLRR